MQKNEAEEGSVPSHGFCKRRPGYCWATGRSKQQENGKDSPAREENSSQGERKKEQKVSS